MRRAQLLAACSLVAACSSTPAPDPIAVMTVRDIAPAIECPPPSAIVAPAELLEAVDAPAPTWLPAGSGDYGVTRDGVEAVISGYRLLQGQLARWRAWAGAE